MAGPPKTPNLPQVKVDFNKAAGNTKTPAAPKPPQHNLNHPRAAAVARPAGVASPMNSPAPAATRMAQAATQKVGPKRPPIAAAARTQGPLTPAFNKAAKGPAQAKPAFNKAAKPAAKAKPAPKPAAKAPAPKPAPAFNKAGGAPPTKAAPQAPAQAQAQRALQLKRDFARAAAQRKGGKGKTQDKTHTKTK